MRPSPSSRLYMIASVVAGLGALFVVVAPPRALLALGWTGWLLLVAPLVMLLVLAARAQRLLAAVRDEPVIRPTTAVTPECRAAAEAIAALGLTAGEPVAEHQRPAVVPLIDPEMRIYGIASSTSYAFVSVLAGGRGRLVTTSNRAIAAPASRPGLLRQVLPGTAAAALLARHREALEHLTRAGVAVRAVSLGQFISDLVNAFDAQRLEILRAPMQSAAVGFWRGLTRANPYAAPLAEQRGAAAAIAWLRSPQPTSAAGHPRALENTARFHVVATVVAALGLAGGLTCRWMNVSSGAGPLGSWKALHVEAEGLTPRDDAALDRLNEAFRAQVKWDELRASEHLGFDFWEGKILGAAKVVWDDHDLAVYLRDLRAFSATQPALRFVVRSEPEGVRLSLAKGRYEGGDDEKVSEWIRRGLTAPPRPRPQPRRLATPTRERQEPPPAPRAPERYPDFAGKLRGGRLSWFERGGPVRLRDDGMREAASAPRHRLVTELVDPQRLASQVVVRGADGSERRSQRFYRMTPPRVHPDDAYAIFASRVNGAPALVRLELSTLKVETFPAWPPALEVKWLGLAGGDVVAVLAARWPSADVQVWRISFARANEPRVFAVGPCLSHRLTELAGDAVWLSCDRGERRSLPGAPAGFTYPVKIREEVVRVDLGTGAVEATTEALFPGESKRLGSLQEARGAVLAAYRYEGAYLVGKGPPAEVYRCRQRCDTLEMVPVGTDAWAVLHGDRGKSTLLILEPGGGKGEVALPEPAWGLRWVAGK